MKLSHLLLIPLLITLCGACAGEPTRAQAGPQGVSGAANSLLDDPEVLGSAAEAAAIQREQEMLAELAKEGIYPETTPCQVTVKYFRSNTTLGLYNESYVSQSEYYTNARHSADYKVVSDLKMGALLKSLSDLGYFKKAQSGIQRMPGASVAIVIRKGQESWTLNWGQVSGDELAQLAFDCADAVRLIYDTERSVQVVDNADGADFFLKERERIQRENALRQVSGAVSGGGR